MEDREQAAEGATSLHQRIRDEIRQRIFAGLWLPGHRIPFEHELMAQFACSRMTVNKAIGSLVAAGFLERRKKAGTFVTHPSGHVSQLRIPDIRAAILETGHGYDHRLLGWDARRATAEDRRAMRLDRAERLLDLATLHLADGTPFAFERRRINLAAAPAAAAVDFTEVAPSVWLLGHVPWSKAEHRIDACAADAELADRLGVARGAALLRVERRTWAQVGTITQALQFFPAGTLALTATSGIDGP